MLQIHDILNRVSPYVKEDALLFRNIVEKRLELINGDKVDDAETGKEVLGYVGLLAKELTLDMFELHATSLHYATGMELANIYSLLYEQTGRLLHKYINHGWKEGDHANQN